MRFSFSWFIIGCFAIILAVFVIPRAAHATVPVDCPPAPLTPCRVWDVGYTGEVDTLGVAGLPTGTTFLSVKAGHGYKKEVFALGDLFSNPASALQSAFSALSWDSFAWMLGRQILHIFTQEMVSWIRTGQFGGGPLFSTDLVGELFNAADNAAGHFLAQYASEEWYQLLCSPFRPHIYLALGSGRIPYIERARCTVTDIVDNLENFYTDFSNGGWAAWFSTIEPQNNPYGLYLLSLEEKERREREVTFDIRHNFLAGQGFIGLKKCVEYSEFIGPPEEGQPPPKPTCVKSIVVTPGKVVEDQLSQALNTDLQKLGVADELNEVIAAVFDELLSWLVSGGSSGGGLLYSDLPDPEPIEPVCEQDTDRPNGCICDTSTQCLSGFCTQEGFMCADVPAPGEEQEEGASIPPQELVIVSPSPLPDAPLGLSTWSYQFLAEGGVLPYTWSAVDTGINPLPSGLFLSSSGLFSGTPLSPGTWTFTVKVTDSVGEDIQSTFILTIQ
jgi:hypothetical protein